MNDFTTRKVSLVLGSGGARGLAHIGVIKALEEKGAIIDEVVGCSMGSVIGGFYAYGKLPVFEEWVCSLKKTDIIKYMDFTVPTSGLLKGVKIIEKMKELIPDTDISSLPIQFAATTTELIGEEDTAIRTGSLYEAIRASIGIPGIFTAIQSKDKIFVDGGVVNPLPLNHVTRRPDNIVVAVNLSANPISSEIVNKKCLPEKQSSLTTLLQSYSAMKHRLSKLTIDLYKPDYIVNISENIVGSWEYDKAEFLINKGKELTFDVL